MKFKNWLVRSLGIFTTALSLVLIYLVLFKDGDLRPVSKSMLIEFGIIIMLAIYTKFFWYTSVESDIRSSEDYLKKRGMVVSTIETEIEDAQDFDEFIEAENDSNYNKYVSNRCKHMTVQNYKLSFFDKIHKLLYRKDKQYYMVRYMLKVEHQAGKLHKLSGANIRSLTQSVDGLTDDRNNADNKKVSFLISGSVISFISMFLTAAVVFTSKDDFDKTHAILKMCIYSSNIMFSILQAILKARLTVSTEDLAYFNKVISILEKYSAYKHDKKHVTKISYIPEVDNGSKNINIDTSRESNDSAI